MFEEPKEKYSLRSIYLSPKNKTKTNTKTEEKGHSVFVSRIQSINGLHLLSATAQLFLGLTVVALSLVGLIQPAAIATVMTVIGSLTSMIGLYFMYTIFSKHGTFDTLLNKAIKRVITFQN
ncbi:MAG: hypothetical protein WC967_11960 [Balneolaceae bacterium]